MFRATERRLARHTDAIVTVSTEIRDELLDLGIGSPSRYHVIPVGLDLEALLAVRAPSGALRARLRLGHEVPLVGAAGRLVAVKDLDTLMAAIARLPGVHLALIGDGETRAELEARAPSPDLAGRVHFTGWWDDMAQALSDLDVVVLTSRNEGTPLALIEAGAAARPVVATDVGGVRAVGADRETGLLCSPGAPDQVAARVSELLWDRGRAKRMGAAARRQVSAQLIGRLPRREPRRRHTLVGCSSVRGRDYTS